MSRSQAPRAARVAAAAGRVGAAPAAGLARPCRRGRLGTIDPPGEGPSPVRDPDPPRRADLRYDPGGAPTA